MDELDLGYLFNSPAPATPKPKVRRRNMHNKPLPRSEQKSAVQSLLNTGAGALQIAGDALSFLPNHLMGAGLATMHAAGIPGAPEHGFFEGVSGRPALEKLGIVGPNTDKGWVPDAGDVAGFAADTLADPLTYATLGLSAVGKAGKFAKSANVLTKGADKYQTLRQIAKSAGTEGRAKLAEAARKQGLKVSDLKGMADEQLGGLFGLQVPGTKPTYIPKIAKGKSAQAVGQTPSRAVGAAGELINNLSPRTYQGLQAARRYGAAMFDPAVQGMTTEAGQDLARRATRSAEKADVLAGEEALKIGRETEALKGELGQAFPQLTQGMSNDEANKALSQAVGRSSLYSMEKNLPAGALQEVAGVSTPQLEQKISQYGAGLKGRQDKWADELADTGVDVPRLLESADFSHGAREATPYADKQRNFDDVMGLSTDSQFMKGRNLPTKYLPAHVTDKMLHDQNLLYQNVPEMLAEEVPNVPKRMAGTLRSKSDMAAYINNHPDYWRELEDAARAANGPPTVHQNPNNIKPPVTARQLSQDIGEYISEKGDKFLKNNQNLYTHEAGATTAKYGKQFIRAKTNAHEIHSYLQDEAAKALQAGVTPPKMTAISDIFQQMGWNPQQAAQYAEKTFGAGASNAMVPLEAAQAVKSFWTKSTDPQWQRGLLKAWDNITGFYKKALTLPFPGFHGRNSLSAHWMNMASNEIENGADLVNYTKAIRDIHNTITKGTDPQLLDEMLARNVLPTDMKVQDVALGSGLPKHMGYGTPPVVGGIAGSVLGPTKAATDAFKEARQAGSSVVGATGQAIKKGLNPVNILQKHMERGSDVAKQIETSVRGGMYTYLRKYKGWDADAAAKRVAELQVDYSKLGAGEKKFMKRVVPFYSYMRKSVPEVLRQAGRRPGMLTAQTIRAGNRGRDENMYVPSYVSEGLSIQSPFSKEGYLTEFGLPTDQLSDLFVKGPTVYGSLRRTSQKLASQMHPVLKFPIEMTTGTNLFSGKPVQDMYQYPFNNPLGNMIMGALPSSRAQSTMRTLFDERKTLSEKAVNVLTGAHITHPSGGVEKEARYAAKKLAAEIAREDPAIGSFEELYVKKGKKPSPDTERLMRVKAGLDRDLRKMNKRKRKKPQPQ